MKDTDARFWTLVIHALLFSYELLVLLALQGENVRAKMFRHRGAVNVLFSHVLNSE